MRARHAISAALLAWVPDVAQAGPPFQTDDPVPTDTGQWEVYAPQFEVSGKGSDYSGAAGVELNYGAAPELQITVGLPVDYAHDASGWSSGAGDLAVSAKYRFYHNERSGLSIAAFPGVTLPTASNGMGAGRVTAFLPVWVQKDTGPWSVFGGGGYAINPGVGNRDYWAGGIAVTRQVNEHLLLGVEAGRQGADTVGGSGATNLGLGAIIDLGGPFRIHTSVGPTFGDAGGSASLYGFFALGFDF